MQGNQPYGPSFSAKDIERYYNGDMPAQERHALEKAALDDPFLADALEGYAHTGTPVADIAQLKTALHHRTDKKAVPMLWGITRNNAWRVAAMLVLMVGTGWLIYQLAGRDQNEVALQKVETATPETAIPFALDTANKRPDSITDVNNSILPLTAAPVHEQKADKASTNVARKTPEASVPVRQAVPTISAAHNKNMSLFKNEIDTATIGAAPYVASNSVKARSGMPPQDGKIVRGKVTNVQNEAVPFAVIKNEKENMRTTADVNGNFELPIRDTATQVQVSAVGYGTKKLALNEKENMIVLQPQTNALQEVVVESSLKREINKAARIHIEEAEPAAGWRYFNDYVIANLKSPDELNISPANGAVRLSFDVDAKGKAINIKVEKSLCARCDEEAIRILKDSPKWKKKKNKRAKASVRF